MGIHDADALLLKKRDQGTHIGIVLICNELSGLLVDGGKLLRCRHSRNVLLLISRMHHVL